MRNDWYPNRMAEYVTLKQLRETGVEDAVKERDSTFGVEEHQVQQTSTPEEYFEEEDEEAISVDMALLSVSDHIPYLFRPHADILDSLSAH